MSMQNWLQDAQSYPNNDNGAFPNGDPSMAFMQTPSNPTFDFNHMQTPQMQQQRMQNGIVRNGSPTYNNSMYQTQPMIPSKRPRPREDSIGASPQQHPGNLAGSRSQTPQAPYPGGFQGAVNGSHHFPGPGLYQSAQQPGGHASPSPVVQNQSFNPGQHQRVQTMSPSPFSPATQNFAHQASPPQSENGSRVNTPQNGGSQYAQGMSYPGAQNQPFAPPMASQVNGAGLAQYNQHLQIQHQQQQQRMHEIRMRQLQQQRQQASAVNQMSQNPNQMSTHQIAALRAQQVQLAQQAQLAQQRPNNPEQLLRTLQQWAGQHGQQFNVQPMIAGRPISSVQLFIGVVKMGGSKKITALGQWPHVAHSMQFQGQQQMMAAQELQNYWQGHLALYEHLFGVQQKQQRAMMDPLRTTPQGQAGEQASRQDAFSPPKPVHSQSSQHLTQPQPQSQSHTQASFPNSAKQGHLQKDLGPTFSNGHLAEQVQVQAQTSNIHNRSQSTQATVATRYTKPATEPKVDPWPAKTQLNTEFEPAINPQGGRTVRSWGGLEIGSQSPFLEAVDEVLKYKLSVPKLEELGMIDIRALTLSLRSGLHAEVRLALDTLASLTKDYSGLLLDHCEDLLETLIDCADSQVQLLVDHSTEVSDEMLFNSYEETIRGCKTENVTLQSVPEYGTTEFDLDRAVNKLICVTTIIRNLSMLDANQSRIADPLVVRFMAIVIRYVGTRSMLLRAHRNVLDFSKDILTILANVSQHIDLPGKEEALCILHFLLAFAPSPPPINNEDEVLTFPSYLPRMHRYYPYAIDCMAKLLARGDPNRTFYRLIFAADTLSSPPSELLTRSFGLAIAALPEMGSPNLGALIKIRLPYLLQGLLAAEILTSLIPSSENELARSWLTSQDGFALSLSKLVIELGQQPQLAPQRHHPGRTPDPDPFGHATISERGFTIVWKLSERAKDATTSSKGLPFDVRASKQSVLAAMGNSALPPNVSRQLYALSIIDS